MITRHGYFIPKQNILCGDLELATESREIYDSFGFTKGCDHEKCKDGELCPKRYYKYAQHYDGVSIVHHDNGVVVKRVCLTDFFSTKFRHAVRDYPFI